MWAALLRMPPGRLVVFLVSAVFAGVCLVSVLLTQFGERPYTPPAARADAVDVSDLPGWWELYYKTADWYGNTSVPTWDGSTLTAKTNFYPDSDAMDPANRICVAMSMYWAGKPGTVEDSFRPVRVLDQAGNVLVSRHSFGDKCTWRR